MQSIYFKKQGVVLNDAAYCNPNRYNALDAALAFLIFVVVFFLSDYAFSPIISLFYLVTEDYAFCSVLSLILSQGLIFLIAFAFSRIKKVGLFSGGGIVCGYDAIPALYGVMAALGVFFLLENAHYDFVNDWTELLYLTDYQTYSELNSFNADWSNPFFSLLYTFVLVPLLPAVCEEALFRGVIMNGLRQFGDLVALILSAVIFALMHGSFEQIVLQFAIGLIIGGAVIITDNFFVGSAVHFCYNLGVSILSAFPEIVNQTLPYYGYLYDAITVVIAFVFIILSVGYFGKIFLKNYEGKIKNSPKTARFFKYYLLKDKKVDETEFKLNSYSTVTSDFYEKDNREEFFYNGDFYPFNKKSNRLLSVMLLTAAIILSVIKIILSL